MKLHDFVKVLVISSAVYNSFLVHNYLIDILLSITL